MKGLLFSFSGKWTSLISWSLCKYCLVVLLPSYIKSGNLIKLGNSSLPRRLLITRGIF